MKTLIFLLSIIFLTVSCTTGQNKGKVPPLKMVYQPEDRVIFEKVLQKYLLEKNTDIGDLMIKVGSFFLETPYVSHTLEIEPEQLVINLRELDCTTFVENVLAISRTIKSENPSFEKFAKELQFIRYHNGKIDGYPSRIHYFSDWIYENDEKKLVNDISKEVANTPYPLSVNFMSTHPQSYVQLKNPEFVTIIAKQEKEISSRKMYYVPEEKLAGIEKKLKDGDIAGITTRVKGLDISHVVLLVWKDGRIHILHASTSSNKVILSDETLEDYLAKSKMANGIMVARPL